MRASPEQMPCSTARRCSEFSGSGWRDSDIGGPIYRDSLATDHDSFMIAKLPL
jgi:hypothetical protein